MKQQTPIQVEVGTTMNYAREHFYYVKNKAAPIKEYCVTMAKRTSTTRADRNYPYQAMAVQWVGDSNTLNNTYMTQM